MQKINFNVSSHGVIYYTPPGGRGVFIHQNGNDFILQIEDEWSLNKKCTYKLYRVKDLYQALDKANELLTSSD